MKIGAMAVTLLVCVSLGFAQQQAPATQTQPGAQATAPATTAPHGKGPLQAKTQAEFDAYQAAVKVANDPPAIEKAADDFAAKFPASDLRAPLYRAAMHSYQTANNSQKMMEMGRKVLGIDPDDPEALLGVSEVMVEKTGDTDLDKQQKLDEALKMAQHCLETIDTDITVPPGTPQAKVDDYKAFLRSSAEAVIGAIQYNMERYPDAEASLRKSIDAYPAQPDPIAVFRLALSLDKQDRYPEALKYAGQAVDLTQENTPVGTAARRERDRLVELTGGTVPAPAAKPSSAATPTPPSR